MSWLDFFKKHGGKTVSISTLLMVGASLVQLNVLDTAQFVPATRAYVTQQTKGLPYIVRSTIQREADSLWYAVFCMSRREQEGALSRLVEEYRTLTGETYQPKTCEQLDALQGIRR